MDEMKKSQEVMDEAVETETMDGDFAGERF